MCAYIYARVICTHESYVPIVTISLHCQLDCIWNHLGDTSLGMLSMRASAKKLNRGGRTHPGCKGHHFANGVPRLTSREKEQDRLMNSGLTSLCF